MMNLVEKALAEFAGGLNCAQAVLVALGPELGLSRDRCLQVAAAFGGGVARRGELCGTVSGALMALGLADERIAIDPAQVKVAVYERASEFMDRFRACHGSLQCRELLGCDLSTPDGRAYAAAKDFHHTRCPAFVQTAVMLVEEMAGDQK